MNLSQAAQLYGKGLEAVEPWAFMDLTTNAGGSSVNVPIELYNAYVNVFSGMTITTNVTMVEGEAFKAIADPIAGCLSKNGVVVPNVKLMHHSLPAVVRFLPPYKQITRVQRNST